MAVVTTDKALNLCSRLAVAADQLMQAIEQLAALKAEKEASGLDLTAAALQTALAASALKHANGDDFNNVLTSGAAIKTWMEQNFHNTNLDKVRP